VLRTRDPSRLLAALEAHLSGHGPPPPGTIHIGLPVAVLPDDTAVILPPVADLATIDSRLRALGVHLIDAPRALLEPANMRIMVPEPAVRIAEPHRSELLASLGEPLGARRREGSTGPGPRVLRGVFVVAAEAPPSRAELLVALLATANLAPAAQADVARLADGLRTVATHALSDASGATIVPAVRRLCV
jgi:hypothetical protein